MSEIYSSVHALVGRTPMLRLLRTERSLGLTARLLAKLEYLNPTGSVKDRAALAMLDEAERTGKLCPDGAIIEPTSGNMGISLAALAAARGYRAILVMPEHMSRERRLLIEAYGAEVVLTEAALGMRGAIDKAKELARQIPNSFMPSQFDNPQNARAHFKTTGPEIYRDTGGEVDVFVCGVGTGGTLTGVGQYLKMQRSSVRIVAVEPSRCALLSTGTAGEHRIQGIGAGFVPDVLGREVIDEVAVVSEQEAYAAARSVAEREGIFVGISSGAALHAAIRIASRKENRARTVVALLPDTGERYLSDGEFLRGGDGRDA